MTYSRNDCIDHHQQGTKQLYGKVWVDGRTVAAHRYAYCFANGIPIQQLAGLVVRHSCDNRRCINPRHLSIGTHQDNADDMVQRNRQSKGSTHTVSKLTEQQVTAIRKEYVPWSKHANQRALARKYGVVQGTITFVLKGGTWKHV